VQGNEDSWTVINHDDFDPEFDDLNRAVQDEILAARVYLKKYGPTLGRPFVDTLSGSSHANMKEFRFEADKGVWRVAFAFDPVRRAILLVAADKSGVSQKRFYKTLIAKADKRFSAHLKALKKE
jgi:hypothetical protein